MLEILKTILYGIVQGISEWLPISSTGHMLLLNQFCPLFVFQDEVSNEAFFNLFLVVIQFGSILAVIVLFFNKLWPFKSDKKESKEVWTLWAKVLVGIIPAGIAGILLDDIIDAYLHGPLVIAITLIFYGVLFFFIDEKKGIKNTRSLNQLSFKTAFLIGCFQMLALIPGTSRSGATILGGLLLGCTRAVSSEFSFFLAIPFMAGASLLKLIKAKFIFDAFSIMILLVGTLISFIISLFAIRFLMNYVRTHTFKIFGIYRVILGIVILAVLFLQ